MPIRKRLTGSDNVSKNDLPVAILSEETAAAIGVVWEEMNMLKPRARLKAALAAIPLGKTMPLSEWNNQWVIPFLKQRFLIKGIPIAIYPVDRRAMFDDNFTTCITAQVSVLMRHPISGHQHVLKLQGDFREAWYMSILSWLVETGYTKW